VPIAFVMPCLNEERFLEAAAASLGFGDGPRVADEDTFLVLVDNASEDRTRQVMEGVAGASRPGSVRIVAEPERGFVPPRRRGVEAVAALGEDLGASPEQILVLQADADTVYWPGYGRWMWDRLADRRGFLLEGALRRSEDFDVEHSEYRALEQAVDAELEKQAVDDADDVVVDDKACGYLLADYLLWGGHFREFAPDGSEVHAETTRLYIRAQLAHGARKLRVNPAQATASRRRLIEDPALHFATKGFPREASWVRRWHERHRNDWSVDEFAANPAHPDVREACFMRRAHEIALMELLPWIVARAADPEAFVADGRKADLMALVPSFSAAELAQSPAKGIVAVLDAIDRYPTFFDEPPEKHLGGGNEP
jgi:hypothetical protein